MGADWRYVSDIKYPRRRRLSETETILNLRCIAIKLPMTNAFSGHIARRLCRIAVLEHENQMCF
jgi:hypothetical protein